MAKKRLLIVGLIGLLLAGGLVLIGCEEETLPCPGDHSCTITVKQGANGLYVDYDAPRSDCGRDVTEKKNGDKISACAVHAQNGYWSSPTKAGIIGCSCD